RRAGPVALAAVRQEQQAAATVGDELAGAAHRAARDQRRMVDELEHVRDVQPGGLAGVAGGEGRGVLGGADRLRRRVDAEELAVTVEDVEAPAVAPQRREPGQAGLHAVGDEAIAGQGLAQVAALYGEAVAEEIDSPQVARAEPQRACGPARV